MKLNLKISSLLMIYCLVLFPSFAFTQVTIDHSEDVREILRSRLCGTCHIPPGNQRALKIFNLNEEHWFRSLSDRQLQQFKTRVVLTDDEIRAQRGNPQKHKFTQIEVNLLSQFVEAELKKRNPAHYLFKD